MTTSRSGDEGGNACSFCGKRQQQVKKIISGTSGAFICDECVRVCDQIIREESLRTSPGAFARESLAHTAAPTPRWIYEKLDEYVVGQESAKKVLSVAVYNHYKRIKSHHQPTSDVELEKSNILLIGPPGSGKTLLAQTLAKMLEVPFAIVDATSLTEAGYVGEDVENILLRLIQAADGDIERAQQGIIYIDEIDKIARKGSNPSITRDVSGEGVQQALLKIIEGCVANVPPQGGRKHPHQEFMQIKTNDILFMCGGVFESLNDIVDRRLSKHRFTLGFNAVGKPQDGVSEDGENLVDHVLGDDLLEFGFIAELVGRLPVFVGLHSLDRDDLMRAFTKPKNAPTKQYQTLFKMDGVDLDFTPEAIEAAADLTIERGLGARGLRAILEQTLLDVMYELPNLNDVKRCVVDAEAITGNSSVRLVREDGQITPLQLWEKKSA